MRPPSILPASAIVLTCAALLTACEDGQLRATATQDTAVDLPERPIGELNCDLPADLEKGQEGSMFSCRWSGLDPGQRLVAKVVTTDLMGERARSFQYRSIESEGVAWFRLDADLRRALPDTPLRVSVLQEDTEEPLFVQQLQVMAWQPTGHEVEAVRGQTRFRTNGFGVHSGALGFQLRPANLPEGEHLLFNVGQRQNRQLSGWLIEGGDQLRVDANIDGEQLSLLAPLDGPGHVSEVVLLLDDELKLLLDGEMWDSDLGFWLDALVGEPVVFTPPRGVAIGPSARALDTAEWPHLQNGLCAELELNPSEPHDWCLDFETRRNFDSDYIDAGQCVADTKGGYCVEAGRLKRIER